MRKVIYFLFFQGLLLHSALAAAEEVYYQLSCDYSVDTHHNSFEYTSGKNPITQGTIIADSVSIKTYDKELNKFIEYRTKTLYTVEEVVELDTKPAICSKPNDWVKDISHVAVIALAKAESDLAFGTGNDLATGEARIAAICLYEKSYYCPSN